MANAKLFAVNNNANTESANAYVFTLPEGVKDKSAMTENDWVAEALKHAANAAARSGKSAQDAYVAGLVNVCMEAFKKRCTAKQMSAICLEYIKGKYPEAHALATGARKAQYMQLLKSNMPSWVAVSYEKDGKEVVEYVQVQWRVLTENTKPLSLAEGCKLHGFKFAASSCHGATVYSTAEAPLTLDSLKYTTQATEYIKRTMTLADGTVVKGYETETIEKNGKQIEQNKTREVTYTYYPVVCGGKGDLESVPMRDGKQFYSIFAATIKQLVWLNA